MANCLEGFSSRDKVIHYVDGLLLFTDYAVEHMCVATEVIVAPNMVWAKSKL